MLINANKKRMLIMPLKRTGFTKNAGVTLVELMIALSLGLLVTFFMGTMYLSSTETFRATSQVGRVQENLRFGSFFIQSSLREVGYMPCGFDRNLNIHLNTGSQEYWIEDGIFGWDYDGTDAGETLAFTYDILGQNPTAADVTQARADNAAASAAFNTSDDGVQIALPDVIEDLSPIAGSDVLAVAVERETSMRSVVAALQASDTVEIDFRPEQNIGQGSIVRFGNCLNSDKFQNESAIDVANNFIQIGLGGVAGYEPGNNNAFSSGANRWAAVHPTGSRVSAEVLKVYYIGTGASGIPSLFEYESECGVAGLATACAQPIVNRELVEGVENMQVFYGVDTDLDGVANQYLSADNVTNFENVVSIRLGLMLRSLEPAELVDTDNYAVADEVTVDPMDIRVTRYVSNSTVHLRNRRF